MCSCIYLSLIHQAGARLLHAKCPHSSYPVPCSHACVWQTTIWTTETAPRLLADAKQSPGINPFSHNLGPLRRHQDRGPAEPGYWRNLPRSPKIGHRDSWDVYIISNERGCRWWGRKIGRFKCHDVILDEVEAIVNTPKDKNGAWFFMACCRCC